MPTANPEPVLAKIRAGARGLWAGGTTAIYDALARAYDIAGESTGQNHYTTIVFSPTARATRPN